MEKNKLYYSELTDKVYWKNGEGKNLDVTDNFVQMMLIWLTNASLPKVGKKRQRVLKVNNVIHCEIEVKRIEKPENF